MTHVSSLNQNNTLHLAGVEEAKRFYFRDSYNQYMSLHLVTENVWRRKLHVCVEARNAGESQARAERRPQTARVTHPGTARLGDVTASHPLQNRCVYTTVGRCANVWRHVYVFY